MSLFEVEGLPDSVRVGPFDIKLTVRPMLAAAAAGEYGHFDSLCQEIVIQATFAHWTKACDTLIHEIMHAIYWAYDLKDDDAEEETVAGMATGLLGVLRDNPWLCAWVFQFIEPRAA